MVMEGLKVNNNKSLEQSVKEAVKKYSGVELKKGDILQCHRFGPDEATSGKPCQVFIRFSNPSLKVEIMRCKQQFRQSPVFLRELLTTKQNSILFQAKEAQRLGIIHHSWTRHGQV